MHFVGIFDFWAQSQRVELIVDTNCYGFAIYYRQNIGDVFGVNVDRSIFTSLFDGYR